MVNGTRYGADFGSTMGGKDIFTIWKNSDILDEEVKENKVDTSFVMMNGSQYAEICSGSTGKLVTIYEIWVED